MKTEDKIIIRGLRQNNLKNVSLDIPKGKIVVFTGVSGSGKSSIVFDTIAAESQRQMNETYTAFMRGRLPKYEKPKVDRIDNLSASVIVDQSRLGGMPAPPWAPSATCTPPCGCCIPASVSLTRGRLPIFPLTTPTVCARPAPASEKFWIWTSSGPSTRTNPGTRIC